MTDWERWTKGLSRTKTGVGRNSSWSGQKQTVDAYLEHLIPQFPPAIDRYVVEDIFLW